MEATEKGRFFDDESSVGSKDRVKSSTYVNIKRSLKPVKNQKPDSKESLTYSKDHLRPVDQKGGEWAVTRLQSMWRRKASNNELANGTKTQTPSKKHEHLDASTPAVSISYARNLESPMKRDSLMKPSPTESSMAKTQLLRLPPRAPSPPRTQTQTQISYITTKETSSAMIQTYSNDEIRTQISLLERRRHEIEKEIHEKILLQKKDASTQELALRSQVAQLEEQQIEMNGRSSQYIEQLSNLHREIAQLEEQKGLAKSQTARSMEQVGFLKSKIVFLEQQRAQIKFSIDNLVDQIKACRLRILSLREDSYNIQTEFSTSVTQISTLKKTIALLEDMQVQARAEENHAIETCALLQAEVNGIEHDRSQAEAELANAAEQISSLQSQIELLEKQRVVTLTEVSRHTDEVTLWQKRLLALEEARERDKSKTAEAVEKETFLYKRWVALEQEHLELTMRTAKCVQQAEAMQTQALVLEEQQAQAQAEYSQSNDASATLTVQIQSLERTVAEAEAESLRSGELVQVLQKQLSDMKEEVSALQEREYRAADETAMKHAEVFALEKQRAQCQLEAVRTMSLMSSLQAQINLCEEQRDTTRKRCSQAVEKEKEIPVHMSYLESEIARVRSDIQDHKNSIVLMEAEKRELLKHVEGVKNDSAQAMHRVTSLQITVMSLEDLLTTALTERSSIIDEFNRLRTYLQSVEADFDKRKERLASVLDEEAAIKAHIQAVVDEQDNVANKTQAVMNDIRIIEQDIAFAEEQLFTIQQSTKDIFTSISLLNKQFTLNVQKKSEGMLDASHCNEELSLLRISLSFLQDQVNLSESKKAYLLKHSESITKQIEFVEKQCAMQSIQIGQIQEQISITSSQKSQLEDMLSKNREDSAAADGVLRNLQVKVEEVEVQWIIRSQEVERAIDSMTQLQFELQQSQQRQTLAERDSLKREEHEKATRIRIDCMRALCENVSLSISKFNEHREELLRRIALLKNRRDESSMLNEGRSRELQSLQSDVALLEARREELLSKAREAIENCAALEYEVMGLNEQQIVRHKGTSEVSERIQTLQIRQKDLQERSGQVITTPTSYTTTTTFASAQDLLVELNYAKDRMVPYDMVVSKLDNVAYTSIMTSSSTNMASKTSDLMTASPSPSDRAGRNLRSYSSSS